MENNVLIEPVPVKIHMISRHCEEVKFVSLLQGSQANPVLGVDGGVGQVLDGGGGVREIKLKLGRFLKRNTVVAYIKVAEELYLWFDKSNVSPRNQNKIVKFQQILLQPWVLDISLVVDEGQIFGEFLVVLGSPGILPVLGRGQEVCTVETEDQDLTLRSLSPHLGSRARRLPGRESF